MKQIVMALLCLAGAVKAQSPVPWNLVNNIPVLAAQSGNALFYVSSYTTQYLHTGVHTDYDLARRDADAFLQAHPSTPTYVILSPASAQTCDDVPLPVVARGNGTFATIGIVGYGSSLSTIQKRPGCASTQATLLLNFSTAGPIESAVFQGFTIDSAHIDSAACDFYGVSHSMFFDVACGNAKPGADHEVEFGNAGSAAAGLDSALTLYNLKSFDTVGSGRGAVLTPVWNGGSLNGVTVVSQGTKAYSHQFSRAQIIGPSLATCSTLPALTPTVSTVSQANFGVLSTVAYGYVTGVTIQNPGKCGDTSKLYVLLQDGVPVMTGMKFSNMSHSQVWNLEPTGANQYGEVWGSLSGANTVIGEHPYTNQTVQIADFASGNQHINTFFDSPGLYGAALYGPTGTFANAIFSWENSTYHASGYLLGQSHGASSRWQITNSQCSNSIPNFIPVVLASGPLALNAEPPSHTQLNDLEVCDGSIAIAWPTAVSPI